MDKNKKLEKISIFGNVSSYFVIFAGTFKYTVFPPFFYYKLLQDETELVKKHGSIFIEYQSFLVVRLLSLKNDVEDLFEKQKKNLEKHLLKNNLSLVFSFKQSHELQQQESENQTFEKPVNLVTLVLFSGQFVFSLFELITKYIVKKIVKDLFQTKVGVILLWFFFLTLGVLRLVKKNYNFDFLNLNESLPAFHVLSKKMSFETLKYIVFKNKTMTNDFSNFVIFDQTTLQKERKKTSLKKQSVDKKQDITKLGEEKKSSFSPLLPQNFHTKKEKNQSDVSILSNNSQDQSFDFFPDTIFMKINEIQNAQKKQLYRGIFKEKKIFQKKTQQIVISSVLKNEKSSFYKKKKFFGLHCMHVIL